MNRNKLTFKYENITVDWITHSYYYYYLLILEAKNDLQSTKTYTIIKTFPRF